MIRTLTDDLAKSKCGLGTGKTCCAFLAFGNGWQCLQDSMYIAQRLAAGTMNAQGPGCDNPLDDTSHVNPPDAG